MHKWDWIGIALIALLGGPMVFLVLHFWLRAKRREGRDVEGYRGYVRRVEEGRREDTTEKANVQISVRMSLEKEAENHSQVVNGGRRQGQALDPIALDNPPLGETSREADDTSGDTSVGRSRTNSMDRWGRMREFAVVNRQVEDDTEASECTIELEGTNRHSEEFKRDIRQATNTALRQALKAEKEANPLDKEIGRNKGRREPDNAR